LDHFHAVNALEDCEEEGDLLDDEELFFRADDVDAVPDVVWVLDEEEDAGAEEFLGGDGEDEGEGEEGCAGCCEGGDEVGVLEGDCLLLVKVRYKVEETYRK
jgi:hypothetical protein